MVVLSRPTMTLHSRPYKRRIALIPMSIALVLGWALEVLSIFLAVAVLKYDIFWGIARLALVGAFGLWLGFITFNWVDASSQTHDLQIDGDIVELQTFDTKRRQHTTQQISLDEVQTAEFYTPSDTASLTLNGRAGKSLEIPLWSFAPESQKQILSYVRERGVNLISVP